MVVENRETAKEEKTERERERTTNERTKVVLDQ
jgi:hypothetical protein